MWAWSIASGYTVWGQPVIPACVAMVGGERGARGEEVVETHGARASQGGFGSGR